jgi:DNA repair exonuclease SbcCD ATPase subunit
MVAEIEHIESLDEDIEALETEIEEIDEQLAALRDHVERIERKAIEEFNDRIAEVLDILEYENIERVWIERKEVETRDGRRKVTEKRFDLHVVRTGEDGTAYEDTAAHLSESEREVTGLIIALAGYFVHDLHETVPFMILATRSRLSTASASHASSTTSKTSCRTWPSRCSRKTPLRCPTSITTSTRPTVWSYELSWLNGRFPVVDTVGVVRTVEKVQLSVVG